MIVKPQPPTKNDRHLREIDELVGVLDEIAESGIKHDETPFDAYMRLRGLAKGAINKHIYPSVVRYEGNGAPTRRVANSLEYANNLIGKLEATLHSIVNAPKGAKLRDIAKRGLHD